MKILLFAVFVGLVGVIESGEIKRRNALVRERRASAVTGDREASVLRVDTEVNPLGFNYVYETSNGISAQSVGEVKGDAINVQGQYAYTSPEGVPVKISYTADEEGYKPVGDFIPVPPPTPEAILRALAYIDAHPPPVETYKKQ